MLADSCYRCGDSMTVGLGRGGPLCGSCSEIPEDVEWTTIEERDRLAMGYICAEIRTIEDALKSGSVRPAGVADAR